MWKRCTILVYADVSNSSHYDVDHCCISSGFSEGFCITVRTLPLASSFGSLIHAERYQHTLPGRHFIFVIFLCSYKAEDTCIPFSTAPPSYVACVSVGQSRLSLVQVSLAGFSV